MTRRRRPLAPVEIATAGILAGLAVALGLLASVMPILNIVFQVGAAVPIAMVASRFRARAGLGAAAVTILMSAAIGGLPTAWTVAQTVLVGLVVGALRRRGARLPGVLAAGVGVGLLGAGLSWALLALLPESRELVLESARTSMNGYLDLLGKWAPLQPSTALAKSWVDWLVAHWWAWIPASAGLGLLVLLLAAHWLLARVLERLDFALDWDPLVAPAPSAASAAPSPSSSIDEAGAAPGPLPATLTGVGFVYPGSLAPALDRVDLEIGPGFTVVSGPNGSGKSTLALVLAGAAPTSGSVTRPGAVGLGEPGGTALVAQRSELQFLGATVAEDVVWGMDEAERAGVDLTGILATVGLRGLEEAETRRLSGGQLQRLALAGALARRPALLISDESTAMIDPEGRRELLEVLASLPSRGTAVVHITHDASEAEGADRLVRLEAGRVVFDGSPDDATARTPAVTGGPDERGASRPRGVGASAGASPDSTDSSRAGDPVRSALPHSPSSNARPRPRDGAMRGQAEERVDPAVHRPASSDPFARPAPWTPTASAPAWNGPVEHLWADRVGHAYDAGTPWEHEVLSDASLIVSPGSALLITGANGSGKSTLARILTGLMTPSRGRCTLGGRDMRFRVGDVAFSRQFARLQLQRPTVGLDILSAAGYGPSVGTGRGRKGRGLEPGVAQALIERALAEVALDASLSRRGVDELSCGQMRRVALAGLLASDPVALVLDEPMAGLDAESRAILVDVLAARKRAGIGLVVISHDVADLGPLCDERLTLADGVLS